MGNILQERTAPEALSQNNVWRQHLSILSPILLVYLALAYYRIDYQSLWLDEVFSIRDATSLALGWKKGQGPLYFIMLHFWMYVGTSELALRLLSVLVGFVAVCLFYVTSLTMHSQRVTIFGTTLFATSPFLIWYSQEVRYIILLLATALFTMYAFWQCATHKHQGWWLIYLGSLILALFSFVANIFLPVVQGFYLLLSPSHRPLLRKWLVCQMLVGMLFIWWALANGIFFQPLLTEVTDDGQQTLSIDPKRLATGTSKEFSPVMLPYTFFALSAGFSQGPSVRELHKSRSLATLLPYASTLVSLGILFGGVFLIGLVATWRYPDIGKLLILWVGVPIVGALGISAVTNMTYNVRYVMMVLPAYVLILAMGIARFRRSVMQGLLLVAILCSNGISLAHYYFNPHYAREDTREAVRYLESVVHRQDVVVMVGKPAALQYYSGGNLPIVALGTHLRGHARERLQEATKNAERVWIVGIRYWGKDLRKQVETILNDAYVFAEHTQFPGVDIYAYQLSRSSKK
jgi:mannosyltransferase